MISTDIFFLFPYFLMLHFIFAFILNVFFLYLFLSFIFGMCLVIFLLLYFFLFLESTESLLSFLHPVSSSFIKFSKCKVLED